MKNLPTRFRYNGFDWNIEYVDVKTLDDDANWGKTDLSRQTISINNTVSEQKKYETLIHELLHIALRFTGLKDKLSFDEEESLIRTYSLHIFGILNEAGLLNPLDTTSQKS